MAAVILHDTSNPGIQSWISVVAFTVFGSQLTVYGSSGQKESNKTTLNRKPKQMNEAKRKLFKTIFEQEQSIA